MAIEAAVIRDPGLQAERTALSWSRTGFSVLANALLALRSGWVNQQLPVTVLACVLLVASTTVVLYGARRKRQLLSGAGVMAPSARAMTATSLVALAACMTALAAMYATLI